MAEKEPFKDSGGHEYTLNNQTDKTLQVFTHRAMRTTYFSAKQTLDLLNFLEANREQIEALAQQMQAKRKPPKTIDEKIDDLFS
jgi:hypothetical protein